MLRKRFLTGALLLMFTLAALCGCDGKPRFAYDGATLTYGKGDYDITYVNAGPVDICYVVAGGIDQMPKEKDKFVEAVLGGLTLEQAQSLRRKYPKMFKPNADITGKQDIRSAITNVGLIYDPALKNNFQSALNAIQNAYDNAGERWCVCIKGDLLNFQSGIFAKAATPEPKIGGSRMQFIFVKEIDIIGKEW